MSLAPLFHLVFQGDVSLHMLLPIAVIISRPHIPQQVKVALVAAWYLLFYVYRKRVIKPKMSQDFSAMSDAQFQNRFRFYRQDIRSLCYAFGMPPVVQLADGITLRRLCYPSTWTELRWEFGLPEVTLSLVFHTTMSMMLARHERTLYCADRLWAVDELRVYAQKIAHKLGAEDGSVVGFLDSTFRPCCRPVRHQRRIYNGWKHAHGWKFQAVIAPNGLVIHSFGPEVGRRNDNRFLRLSGLRRIMALRLRPYHLHLYCDSAYAFGVPSLIRCRRNAPNAALRHAYRLLNKGRISVEWGFGRVLNLWNYCGHKYAQRSLQTQPGTVYRCTVLLTNLYHCFYPGTCQVAQYFDCPVPSPWYYLGVPAPSERELAMYNDLILEN